MSKWPSYLQFFYNTSKITMFKKVLNSGKAYLLLNVWFNFFENLGKCYLFKYLKHNNCLCKTDQILVSKFFVCHYNLLKKSLTKNFIMEIYWQTIERKDSVAINLIVLLNFHVGILTVFLVWFVPCVSVADLGLLQHLRWSASLFLFSD